MRLKDIGYLYSGLTGKTGEDFHVEDPEAVKPYIPFTNVFKNFKVDVADVRYVAMSPGETQNRVRKGDILFLMSSEDYDGIGKPAVVSDNVGEVYLNSFCRGLRVTDKHVSPEFVNYYLNTHGRREAIRLEGRGFTRINIKIDRISGQEIILPKLPDQQCIVAYLDEKNVEIDSALEFLRQKIAAYKRLKASVINSAVTHGLDPKVQLKDSGVDWIGRMPREWDVLRMKDVVICNSDVLPETTNPDFEFDYVDIGSVRHGEGIVDQERVKFCDAPSRARRIVKPGDVIVSTVRTYLKAVALVPRFDIPLIVSTGFAVLRAKDIDGRFLNYVIQSEGFVSKVGALSVGTGYPAINSSNLVSIKLPVPSPEEQRAIADYLDAECAKIDEASAIVEKQIDAYKRLKRSLINEVVTGKRKVA